MNLPLITPEIFDRIVTGTESLTKVATGTAAELTNEAVNLFIIDASLSVLKFAVVFVVFYIVKRYCDTLAQDADTNGKQIFKAFKTTALVLSLIFFTTYSFPHLQTIAKALVAPKIFLLEKTAEIIKK